MATPADVVGELLRRINDGRWTELVDLYAEDVLVEHPLRRTRIDGRKAVGERFARLGTATTLRAFDVTVHETVDPEVVIAEYQYEGAGFTSANVQVVRVRDGLIAHSRDYHDHLRMAAARGDVTGIAVPYAPSPAGPPPAAAPDGTPRAIMHQLLDSIAWENPVSRADFYADVTFVTHPFHPTAPALTSKDELRKHFAPGRGAGLRPRNIVFHEGADPELIVAEFEYAGTVGDGNPVLVPNIFVTRIRDGLIVESRDYGDHVSMAAATGQLPDLIAAARSVVTPAV
jgi:ketosteroid isomerase-like protein